MPPSAPYFFAGWSSPPALFPRLLEQCEGDADPGLLHGAAQVALLGGGGRAHQDVAGLQRRRSAGRLAGRGGLLLAHHVGARRVGQVAEVQCPQADLLGDVTRSFERYGQDPRTADVTLVPGFFETSLQVDQPVALAHIDCDWYDSVQVSLERIDPWLVPGGRFVIDDYWRWSGCQRAVDDFLRGRDDLQVERRARFHIVKRG